MAEKNAQTDGYLYNGEASLKWKMLTAGDKSQPRSLITRALDYLGLERKSAPDFGKGYSTSALSEPWRFTGWGWNKWRGGIDYTQEVGALDESSLVMAVVNWTGTQLPEAAPVIQKPTGKDNALEPEWGHPAADLVRRPNSHFIWADYCGALSLSWWIDGNVYFYKSRDDAGDLQELWYLPHFLIEERWPGDGRTPEVPIEENQDKFLSHYQYKIPGKEPVLYPAKDVIHLKRFVNLNNPRRGIGAFDAVIREIYGDNAVAHFSATLMRNMGMVPYLLAPKQEIQLTEPQAEHIKEQWMSKTTGANIGQPVVNAIPLDVTKLGFDPQELDLSKLRNIPESRIAAVTGIPAAMLQFMVGLENGTSFAAYREARQQGYESVIIPIQSAIAEQLTWQLLPEFKGTEKAKLIFDTSTVRVLQEDRDALYRRATSALQAGGISRNQFSASLGKPPVDKEEIFYVPAMANVMTQERIEELAKGEVEPPPAPDPTTQEMAKFADMERMLEEMEEQMKDFTPSKDGEPKRVSIGYKLKNVDGAPPDTTVEITVNRKDGK